MLNPLIGLFIILHGLVHFWFFTLSRRLVEFQPEMGWTGDSWLLSKLLEEPALRFLASVLYALAAIAFVAAGVGIFARAGWWRPVLAGSALFSSITILLFWDGAMPMLVQKGLIGLLINGVILIVLFLMK